MSKEKLEYAIALNDDEAIEFAHRLIYESLQRKGYLHLFPLIKDTEAINTKMNCPVYTLDIGRMYADTEKVGLLGTTNNTNDKDLK